MSDWTFTPEELTKIHDASMSILGTTGVIFNESEAIDIFKKNGFNVDGKRVLFKESAVLEALKTAPPRFKLTARNPEKSVYVGQNDQVFVGTYGAPFINTSSGGQRPGTLADYDDFCKLVQTSRHVDINGYKHVQPSDVPAEKAYLHMLFANLSLCDKPFMSCTETGEAARDSMEMAGMVFGGIDKLKEMPVMAGLINSLSPLQYAEEMAGALIEYARHGQAVCIANMIMAGTSGPVKLAGLLALMNAEILAGITLAQLVRPGTPVIYGTTSCPTNMKNGVATLGSPETVRISVAATQLARYYNVPCRTGGSLTDAFVPDAQALAEGAMVLSAAVRNGAHFILHACGMVGGYIGNSFEKWLIDEELCGMVRRMMLPIEVNTETLSLEAINRVGAGGNYLMEPETLKSCRTEFYMPELYVKQGYDAWNKKGARRVEESAGDMLKKRLATYKKPDLDPAVEAALREFVNSR